MYRLLSFLIFTASALSFAEYNNITATYTVPVPFKLAKFATFELPKSGFELKGKDLELSYYLPLELVQPTIHAIEIHLRGKVKPFPEQFEMTEPHGENQAHCVLRKEGVTCLVSYKFTPDVNAVLRYLKNNFPISELDSRALVVGVFGGEAGGIVHFPVKTQFQND